MELLSCAFKIHFSIVKTAGHMYKKGTKKKKYQNVSKNS